MMQGVSAVMPAIRHTPIDLRPFHEASPRMAAKVCSQAWIMYSKSLPACIHWTPQSMSTFANSGFGPKA